MAAGTAAGMPLRAAAEPIQLHVDLEVGPSREKQLISTFHAAFEPVIRRQPGFVDVRLLKLRQAVVGKPATKATHRLIISFRTEEQRLAWVASDDHQRVWPQMEKQLTGLSALLYDQV